MPVVNTGSSPRRVGGGGARSPLRTRIQTEQKDRTKKKAQPLPIEVDLIWTMIEQLSAEHRELLKERLLEEE